MDALESVAGLAADARVSGRRRSGDGNGRGLRPRLHTIGAGHDRWRSVQIMTANSAAPIRMAIESTTVGSSGPFITVK